MKTITISDEIYGKLLDAKRTLAARSFSETLKKILSQDRVSWAFNLAGKVAIDESRIKKFEKKWGEWHTG